ncbi:hypothetical protein JS530_07410 [Bifidobacterium sp. LC6]|uniref:Uncharacterized protein n=1 Tax=Bifidobacterium colobi TaxID=2809026 RepID=A0ABS5UW43_9BIFI|nr:hypothetical protein [Bifidobacterium colobi]MBT1175327.1 hypothetical protein [Bifidobacterium colobi]
MTGMNDDSKPADGVHSLKRRDNERTVAGGHRRMRRADREIVDFTQIGEIISRCDIVDVA